MHGAPQVEAGMTTASTGAQELWTKAQHAKNIKRIIETIRANRDLTVAEVIRRSGLPESTYHRKMKVGNWEPHELAALAQALDVRARVFFDDADDLLPQNIADLSSPIHPFLTAA